MMFCPNTFSCHWLCHRGTQRVFSSWLILRHKTIWEHIPFALSKQNSFTSPYHLWFDVWSHYGIYQYVSLKAAISSVLLMLGIMQQCINRSFFMRRPIILIATRDPNTIKVEWPGIELWVFYLPKPGRTPSKRNSNFSL